MQEEITLNGKKDWILSSSFNQSYVEEDASHLGGYSTGHTTCNDIYSVSTMTAKMVACTSHVVKNLEGSINHIHRNRFSLEDCLPPMIFDEAEEREDPGRTFHEDNQTDGVDIKPPNSPIMSEDDGRPGKSAEPLDAEHADLGQIEFSKETGLQNEKSIIKIRSNRFSLEDCLPPMRYDEAEEREDSGRTFHEDNQTDGVDIKPPNSPIMSEDDGRPGDNAEPLDVEHADLGQIKFSRQTRLQNEKIQIILPKFPVSISILATPKSMVPDSAGARTPGFMAVHTPATREGARVSKKRKCLYDDNMIVIPNKVIKSRLDDPSDLVKHRRSVLHNNANRISNKIFFEPIIPSVSINFRSLLHEKEQKTPEKLETTNTPTKTHNIGSLTSDETHREDPIAPSTPVTNSVSQRYDNTCGATNSEKLECARSSASVDRELFPIEDPESDVCWMTKEEETESCERGDKQERHHWSTRTRSVGRFLHKEFRTRNQRGADEVMKLSQVLEGKSKKSNARLFFEILVLTTRGFLNVKQDNPYDDISVVETSKLIQAFEVDNMS